MVRRRDHDADAAADRAALLRLLAALRRPRGRERAVRTPPEKR